MQHVEADLSPIEAFNRQSNESNVQNALSNPMAAPLQPMRPANEEFNDATDPLYDGFAPASQPGNGGPSFNQIQHDTDGPPNDFEEDWEARLSSLFNPSAPAFAPAGSNFYENPSLYSGSQASSQGVAALLNPTVTPFTHQPASNVGYQGSSQPLAYPASQSPAGSSMLSVGQVPRGDYVGSYSQPAQTSQQLPRQTFHDQQALGWGQFNQSGQWQGQATQPHGYDNRQAAEPFSKDRLDGFTDGPVAPVTAVDESQPSRSPPPDHDSSVVLAPTAQLPVQHATSQQLRPPSQQHNGGATGSFQPSGVADAVAPAAQAQQAHPEPVPKRAKGKGKGKSKEGDETAVDDPQPSSSTAAAATQSGQSQQPQQAPAAHNSQPAKPPRAQKKLKQLEVDQNAMLQPCATTIATIQLATEADRAAYTADISWYKPKNSEEVREVPETEEELEPYVLYMVRCMKDTSKAEDKKDLKSSFHKRWSPQALAKKWPVPLEAMEAICWIMVKMARRYHRDGPAFLNFFDKIYQQKANKNQDLTFAERIKAICTVLLYSKSRVDTCLKNENLGSLVAFPLSILKECIANGPFNDQRKQKLDAGAKWIEQEKAKAAAAEAAKNATTATTDAGGQTATTSADKTANQDEAGVVTSLQAGEQEVPQVAEEQELQAVEGDEAERDEIEEEDREIQHLAEEEEEEKEEEEADEDVKDDDDDEGHDDDDNEDEDGNDGAGGSTGLNKPDVTPDEVADRDDGSQSGRQNDPGAGTGASKLPPANGRSHQARAELPRTAAPSTEVNTGARSKPLTPDATARRADPALQPPPPAAHAPATSSATKRKRSAAEALEAASLSRPPSSSGKVRSGYSWVLSAANTLTQNGTQVSFHSGYHLATLVAPPIVPQPATQHAAAPNLVTTSAQASASKGSRKRVATEDHLGFELPSALKRSRNASYRGDAATYGTPRTVRTAITPTLALPMKRRAADAGLEDTNTREKSPRSVDRQIIAPKWRRAPTSDAG